MFLDEADFAGDDFIPSVALPLQTEKNSKFFAASSAAPGGVLSQMISLKNEDGSRFLNCVVLGEPCDACKRSENSFQCEHNLFDLAEWKDPLKFKRTAEIYKRIGREDALKAELFSITSDTSFGVFSDTIYMPLFNVSVAETMRDYVSVIYIGVDPAYGGTCEMAIVALAYCPNSRYKYQVKKIFFRVDKKKCVEGGGC